MQISVSLTLVYNNQGQAVPWLEITHGEDKYIVFNGRSIKDWTQGATSNHRTSIDIKEIAEEVK